MKKGVIIGLIMALAMGLGGCTTADVVNNVDSNISTNKNKSDGKTQNNSTQNSNKAQSNSTQSNNVQSNNSSKNNDSSKIEEKIQKVEEKIEKIEKEEEAKKEAEKTEKVEEPQEVENSQSKGTVKDSKIYNYIYRYGYPYYAEEVDDGYTYSEDDIKAQYEHADNELNMIWQELKKEGKLTDSLIQGELQWIEYKDSLGSYSEKLKATQDRIDFLNSLRW